MGYIALKCNREITIIKSRSSFTKRIMCTLFLMFSRRNRIVTVLVRSILLLMTFRRTKMKNLAMLETQYRKLLSTYVSITKYLLILVTYDSENSLYKD